MLARLARADRERAAFAATAASGNADNGEEQRRRRDDLTLFSSLPDQPRHLTLDLGACRLTDRELRVLLHVLAEERIGDKSIAAAAVAAATGEARTTTGPGRFSALLLGRNPGIGAGALGALWGGGGGGNISQRGLLSVLVRLDLSRCGLTAADLSGFSSAGAGASRHTSTATVCLRALVLRDNALTRVGKRGERGGGGGAMCAGQAEPSWIGQARKGLAALQDLIARAPALETLDVSGERNMHSSVNFRKMGKSHP